MTRIQEGLRERDLEGLVAPIISIDQFESKIDDDAIVVAFYVKYRDPAVDLNRFIQKSAVEILDTEVSPAPTEDGNYVVFVELLRNESFIDNLDAILENISALVDVEKWQFVAFGVKGTNALTDANLKKMVRLRSETDKSADDITEQVGFLEPAAIQRILSERQVRNRRGSTYSLSRFKHLVENYYHSS